MSVQVPPTSYHMTKPVTDDNVAANALAKVRKLLIDGKNDVSLNELLILTEVNPSDYTQALSMSSRGNVVVRRRGPCDCNIKTTIQLSY